MLTVIFSPGFSALLHGRRRKNVFQGGGAAGDFPKFFSRGGQNGEIWFLPLEIEKQPFFANNLKILGGPCPPFRRPCPALFLLFGKVLITFDQLVVQLSCECSWLSRLSFQLLGLLELGVHCSVWLEDWLYKFNIGTRNFERKIKVIKSQDKIV